MLGAAWDGFTFPPVSEEHIQPQTVEAGLILWPYWGGFFRRPFFPLPDGFWLLGHHQYPLNLNAKARCLLLVIGVWPPDVSEALLPPYAACGGFSLCFGRVSCPAVVGEDTLLKPRTVSAPCTDETESKKNIGVFFPLIRNGRRESSLFWVLYN